MVRWLLITMFAFVAVFEGVPSTAKHATDVLTASRPAYEIRAFEQPAAGRLDFSRNNRLPGRGLSLPNSFGHMQPTNRSRIYGLNAADSAAVPVSYGPPVGYAIDGVAGALAVRDVTGDWIPDVVVVVATGVDSGTESDYWGLCDLVVMSPDDKGGLRKIAEYPVGDQCRPDFGGIAVGDLNFDGVADVAVSTNDGIAVFSSDGRGGLRRRIANVGREILQLGILDVDLDGRQDVVGIRWGDIAGGNDTEATTIFYGDGAGGIRSTKAIHSPQRGFNDLKVGDVTGDGLPDLVIISGQASEFWVLPHQRGSGFLQTQAYPCPDTWCWMNAVAIADLDSDGKNEVVVNTSANLPTSALWIYRYDADGRLSPPTRVATLDLPGTMLGADLNGDKREDLAVMHEGYDSLGTYIQTESGALSSERLDDADVTDHVNRQSMGVGEVTGDDCVDVVSSDPGYGVIVLAGEHCLPPVRPRMAGPLPPIRIH